MPIISGGAGASSSGGGVTLITSSVLGASAPTIDFQAIAQTFTHLFLYCVTRTDAAVVADNVLLRFNNDSAGNYDRESLQGINVTASAANSSAATSVYVGDAAGATATAAHFGFQSLWIPHYASTTMSKGLNANTGVIPVAGTATNYEALAFSAGWRSTAAIARITLLPAVGPNFVAGSAAYLYGLL